MSGICGLWDLRGAPLPPAVLAPALDRMRRRGPDGAETWQESALALGHASLVTTPEAALERLPLRHPETGCVITGDARLDNRPELLTALGLDGAGRVIGDGALILAAYLRWGEACPERLLGDFAFAIWDPRRQAMFCARDPMGMRQLIYCHLPGRLFAFATDARAVVTLDGVPRRLNEARVVDFIDRDTEAIDDEVTFFEQVLRLPPGHALAVDPQGLRLRRFWRLEPGTPLHLASDADYAEAFTEVFAEAVRARLRSPETPSAMLSGGMDSGAVVAVAADLLAREGRGPLPTFSAAGNDRVWIETRLIEMAADLPGLAPTILRHEALGPLLPALRARIDDLGDPFDGYMTLIAAVYIAAAQAGVRVMLDGVSGDTCFSAGNALEAAIRDRRLRDILRFARHDALERRQQRYFWKAVLRAGWGIVVPAAIRRRRHAWLVRRGHQRDVARGPVAPEMALRHDLAGRWARYRAHNFPEGLPLPRERASKMTAGYVTAARERYDRIAAAQGIEARDPFCDTRLLSFVLSLPDHQLMRDGHSKYILRRAMVGRLPEATCWNRIFEHHGPDYTQALAAATPDLQPGTYACAQTVHRFVKPGLIPPKGAAGAVRDLDLWQKENGVLGFVSEKSALISSEQY